MTATILAFRYNDQPIPDAQRERVGAATPFMEAHAIWDAAVLYRDAKDSHDRVAAIGRMSRLIMYGSRSAREAAFAWRDVVLGPPSTHRPSELSTLRDKLDEAISRWPSSDYAD